MYELFLWDGPVLIWTSTETSALVLLIVTGPICTEIEKTATFNKIAIKAVFIVGAPS